MSESLEKLVCDVLIDVLKSLFKFNEAYLSSLCDYSNCSMPLIEVIRNLLLHVVKSLIDFNEVCLSSLHDSSDCSDCLSIENMLPSDALNTIPLPL